MKYKIKTIIKKDGSKEYYVQVKYLFFWNYIGEDLVLFSAIDNDDWSIEPLKTREKALQRIDAFHNNHLKSQVQSIEVEYINK